MKTMFKGLSAGVLSLASLGALSAAPAIASSLTGASIGGTAPTDYYVYGVSGNNTVKIPSPTSADLQTVLGGNAGSPTGNVELAATSEKAGFDFTKNTTLSGAIGGKSITLSSLTASDWATSNYNGSSKTFGRYWFESALANAVTLGGNPFPLFADNSTPTKIATNNIIKNSLFNAFVAAKGFERFSDPNISYVNQDNTGFISIGLAGHYNAVPLLLAGLPQNLQSIVQNVIPNLALVQASEVVKYTYDGGNQTGYLYGFKATQTNLVGGDDGRSHNGNYEVTFQGTKPVPVPAGFVGIALAGKLIGI